MSLAGGLCAGHLLSAPFAESVGVFLWFGFLYVSTSGLSPFRMIQDIFDGVLHGIASGLVFIGLDILEAALFDDSSGLLVPIKMSDDYKIQPGNIKKIGNHCLHRFRHQTHTPIIFG